MRGHVIHFGRIAHFAAMGKEHRPTVGFQGMMATAGRCLLRLGTPTLSLIFCHSFHPSCQGALKVLSPTFSSPQALAALWDIQTYRSTISLYLQRCLAVRRLLPFA
ncbi:unnamed protein product [Cyclocybe aegerita]|uniref:Uncharacterized protein n=1 Tax=Cyclocybe aegerita TaxID=1973307 RepID=A0A8S0W2V9_CYCAE|nr:unnamed protein product [Cyclocybe aegerita]